MIRKAKLGDVKSIADLVAPLAEQGLMLPLPLGQVTARLRDFLVDDCDGEIKGVVAVHVTWDRLVELRSLAVRQSARNTGLGKQLVEAAVAEAEALEATEIFTLTYIPEFFEKFGFSRIDRAQLPHKVWQDCTNCPKFPDCGEIALLRPLAR